MTTIADNQQLIPYQPSLSGRLRAMLKSALGLTLLVGYLVILLCVIVYLSRPDNYRSQFSFVLPTTGSSSKVTLEEVGQVSRSATSAFGNQSFSPLSNYKQILASPAVVERAANSMGLSSAQFGKPKVSIIQQTSIMDIKLLAGDADFSNRKSWALIESFQAELDRLRLEESTRYDASIERMLIAHRDRLNAARQAIVDFQQRSLLISTSQMEKAVVTLTKIRDDLTFSLSEREATDKYQRRLSSHLGISPELAGYALTLQSDTQFAAYLAELTDTAAELSRYQSQWGKNHPKVQTEKQRFNVVLAHLQERSTEVVGASSARVLHEMNLSAATKLSELFSDMLEAGAKLSGLDAEIAELRLAEQRTDDELRVYAREYAELERLEREHQRAEAIYNAAAAELEQGKTDIFSSYPLVQLLGQPTLPTQPAAPKLKIAVAAAVASLILLHLSVLILWQRERLINLLLKRH